MKSLENGKILYNVSDGIANITINRPDKMNCLNSQLISDIIALFNQINGDTSIRVVVLRGAKCKAFVAGADLAELDEMTTTFEFRTYYQKNIDMTFTIMGLDQPVITAIDGVAFGGGSGLALASDMVICTDRSKFGTMEALVGFPGNGSTLTKLVGKQKAAELTMLGNVFSAEEAHRFNLVNKVVKPEELEAEVENICKQLKAKSYYALKMAKRVIYNALDSGMSAAGAYESDAASLCFLTDECQKAISAFVQK